MSEKLPDTPPTPSAYTSTNSAGIIEETGFDTYANKLFNTDPRYASGVLTTKFLADELDTSHLEHSTFFVAYNQKYKNIDPDIKKSMFRFRTSFNNQERGLRFWYCDFYSKIKGVNSDWTGRAIISPSAYFMVAHQWKLPYQVMFRIGAETEVGKTPRHFWKLSKTMGEFKMKLMLSGNVACCGHGQWIDTVSLLPRYQRHFKDPLSVLKKFRLGLGFDFNIGEKALILKRQPRIYADLKIKKGVFCLESELNGGFGTELSGFYRVSKELGIYANYRGSLTNLDGVKTIGTQVRIPEFGKIRTSLDSNWILRNAIIYRAHPWASITQHMQFNAKTRENPHFGLGITLGH